MWELMLSVLVILIQLVLYGMMIGLLWVIIKDYRENKKEITPEEVIQFVKVLDERDKELIYDQDEAIEFIQKELKGMNKQFINRGFLMAVLDADEDYMRSKGIIED